MSEDQNHKIQLEFAKNLGEINGTLKAMAENIRKNGEKMKTIKTNVANAHNRIDGHDKLIVKGVTLMTAFGTVIAIVWNVAIDAVKSGFHKLVG